MTRPRRSVRRIVTAAAGAAAGVALLAGPIVNATATTSGEKSVAELTKTIDRIERQPRYAQSDWGYQVQDQRTGRVLAGQNARKMFDPGSTMKSYSVSTALRMYRPGYKFRTPVYRQGPVNGGTLTGNLVLVASGDPSLGLRERPNGTVYYESLPKVNQNYANTGLPGPVEPPGNPLAGLEQLAADVRAAGVTGVQGDVVIDDRLFEPFDGFPDGLIAPIWVNENLVSVRVTPGAVGEPATIGWRPMTASYTVENRVQTVRANQETTLDITETAPGTLQITGQIAARSAPALRVWEVDDPAAFARTAFIEALQRAGVTVAASTTGPNPSALLPPKGSYAPADKLGEHVSAKLAEFAKLIMKVSWNEGADLMTCLAAVRRRSTDCEAGIVAEDRTARSRGVPATSAYIFDGAGSDDRGRTTPRALSTFLRRARRAPYGPALFRSLPVLGRDGTLATVERSSPTAGRAQVKTGNRVVGTPSGKIIVLGNSLAGYARTKHGRRVTFAVMVDNVPLRNPAEFAQVTNDQAEMVVAIQQLL